MKRKIVVKEHAALQLIEAFLWHEQQQENLGVAFLEEWECVANYITEHAESYQKKYKEFRQAQLKRFPYIVVYEIEGRSIIVYSIINAKRHPSKRYKR